MKLRDRLTLAMAGHLAPPLLRGVYAGVRYDVEGADHLDRATAGDRPVIFVAWHGRLLPLLFWYRDRGVVVLVSAHRDGEYVARIAHGWGYGAVRGSSTRGGRQAFRELVRAVRSGRSLAITPDGPQGPRERLKPGALQVARLTGAPVVPILAGTRQAWWIEGWDRFCVPRPFARIRIAVGSPRAIPRHLPLRGLERVAQELEQEMGRLKAIVDGGG